MSKLETSVYQKKLWNMKKGNVADWIGEYLKLKKAQGAPSGTFMSLRTFLCWKDSLYTTGVRQDASLN